jgi:RNA polymerase sigma factor (sigma-70 family)
MPEPAGDLEDLGPRDVGMVQNGRRRGATSLGLRARLGLSVGLVVFTLGALLQILATAWCALLLALFGGSAEVLVHTGGLEPRTFGASSVAAVVLDAVVLLAIATNSARRALRRRQQAQGRSQSQERFAVRHPFAAASLGMSLALAFVIACGWRPSPYFPYPLATIIVLAIAYWFGLLGVFVLARLAELLWRQVKAWGIASEWRAGFLTASLLLIGGAGYWLLTTQWYAAPLGAVHARLEIDDPRDGNVLASELDELCLAANAFEPELAHSSAAPGCGVLAGTRWLDDCFSSLMTNSVPRTKQQLRRQRFNPYDIDDAIMKALLATCTREPPPTSIEDYFFKVALNQAVRMARDARRTETCDFDQLAACSTSEQAEIRELKLARLWDEALCRVREDGEDKAEIIRRRLEQDESFREIGDHLGITEIKAKDTFHNAIKKLRSRALASCDYEGF